MKKKDKNSPFLVKNKEVFSLDRESDGENENPDMLNVSRSEYNTNLSIVSDTKPISINGMSNSQKSKIKFRKDKYLSYPIESLTDEYNADGKLIFMKSSSLYDSVCLCDEKLSFDDIDGICYDTRITVYCIEGHIEDMSRCIYDDELSFDILSGNRGQGVTYKIEILGEETYGFGI